MGADCENRSMSEWMRWIFFSHLIARLSSDGVVGGGGGWFERYSDDESIVISRRIMSTIDDVDMCLTNSDRNSFSFVSM